MKRLLLGIFFFASLTFSCSPEETGNNSEEENTDVIETPGEEPMPEEPIPEEPIPEEQVTYTENVQPIFETYCMNCHLGDNARGGLSLNTFAQAVDKAELVNDRMNDQFEPMPQGGLLDQEIRDVIQNWIDGGLLE